MLRDKMRKWILHRYRLRARICCGCDNRIQPNEVTMFIASLTQRAWLHLDCARRTHRNAIGLIYKNPLKQDVLEVGSPEWKYAAQKIQDDTWTMNLRNDSSKLESGI